MNLSEGSYTHRTWCGVVYFYHLIGDQSATSFRDDGNKFDVSTVASVLSVFVPNLGWNNSDTRPQF